MALVRCPSEFKYLMLLGHGGRRSRAAGFAAIARATGLAISTVTLGRNEVRRGPSADNLVKSRRQGGGRLRHEVVHPELTAALDELLEVGTRRP